MTKFHEEPRAFMVWEANPENSQIQIIQENCKRLAQTVPHNRYLSAVF